MTKVEELLKKSKENYDEAHKLIVEKITILYQNNTVAKAAKMVDMHITQLHAYYKGHRKMNTETLIALSKKFEKLKI